MNKTFTFKLVCEICGTLLLEGTQEETKGTQKLLKKIAANAYPHECVKYTLGRPTLKTGRALWSYQK